MKYPLIVLSALALAGAAQADVTVKFVEPEKFSDIRDNDGFNKRDVLKDLEAHLVAQASKQLPGMDVRINVTDVDLAGQVEPFFTRDGRSMRVMREVTSPSMTLSYEVRDSSNKVVRQGEAKLRDMDYQNSFNNYSTGDPLRYEKRMLDRWMQKEFSPAVAAVPVAR